MDYNTDTETNVFDFNSHHTEDDNEYIKCLNYKLCKSTLPKWWIDCKAQFLCTPCDELNLGELNFVDCGETCPVCLNENQVCLIFPKCGHQHCTSCSKSILFWDETRYHLSQVPYGCPPCPNGCINPIKGKQCYCEEYYLIQDEWEHEHPEQWSEWNDDDTNSIELSETTPGSVFNTKKCSVCRTIQE
jgi:hypothetical protein